MPESSLAYSLDFPRALGGPEHGAGFRQANADFVVRERLGFEPSGEGEHVFLHLQKDGDNTDWIARRIAELAGVQRRDVGYAGLKDRHAIASQWFSVYWPKGAEPDWTQLEDEGTRLLAVTRHRQKLRRGQHAANHFTLRLGAVEGDPSAMEQRLVQVGKRGVPNYFGPQRFGHEAGNLVLADRLLVDGVRIKNRHKRSLALSAGRSYLFNQVLAERVRRDLWDSPLPGEPEPWPTGPLWGRGRSAATDELASLEQGVLGPWADWCHGLEFAGLDQQRRALVLQPADWHWQWEQGDLILSFELAPGGFATAIVRELIGGYML